VRGELADDVFRAVPGDPAERLVDRQQAIVRVEDDDAFAGGLEHRGGQPLLFFAALARTDVARVPTMRVTLPRASRSITRPRSSIQTQWPSAWRTRYSMR
jgi:hypothetical protein